MFGQKILRTITFGLYKGMKKKEDNDNYFSKLVKENNNVSALNFFLLATLFVGIILLIILIILPIFNFDFNNLRLNIRITNFNLLFTGEHIITNRF